jgi:hypothetical protein
MMCMMKGVSPGVLVLAAGCILALTVSVHAQPYVWGTSTASPAKDPGYEGYWKYCFDIGWDVTGYNGYGLSHLDIILGVDCECACNGYFAFADTAGNGIGTTNGDACSVYYFATLLCDGDPAGPPVTAIKFEYYEDDCEPNTVGTMDVSFYSLLEPTAPCLFTDAIGIKFGPAFETGDVLGVMPNCSLGPSEAESSAWGKIKALYR